jgi:hypothetical protein
MGGSSPVGLALAAAVGFGAFFLLLDAGTRAQRWRSSTCSATPR